jgi:hypothetical protein
MMDPVTMTITTEAEMVGLLRGRCLDRGFEIQDLATSDLDNIIIDTALEPDGVCLAEMQRLDLDLKAALDALQRIHGLVACPDYPPAE